MNRKTNLLLLLALVALLAALFAVVSARLPTPKTMEERAAEIRPPVTETPPVWQRARAEETVMHVGPLPDTSAPVPEAKLEPEPPVEEMTEEAPLEFTVAQDDEGPGGTLVWLGRYNIVGYDTCPQCCGNSNGITASGTAATVGRTVAVKGLPFGTRLYIDGIGERVVEDRGYLADGVIDVLCSNHAECYAITGVYDVYIVEEAGT